MTQGNSGAQSQLGELFVSFGTKGVGGLLKNLNSVSASFLLGKNAATQFTQTLTKPIKEAGNAAVAAGKLSTQLATSYREAYRLQMYLKQKNTSEGLLSELGALQKTWANFEKGFGDLGQIPTAFSMLGLNVADYNSQLESMLRLTDDIRKSIAGFDDVTSNQILSIMGLSNEWRYFWERGGNLKDAALISDETIDKNISMSEAMSKLSATTQALKDDLVSRLYTPVTAIANFLTDFETKFLKGEYDNNIKKVTQYTKNAGFAGLPILGTAIATGSVIADSLKQKDIPASIKGTNGVPTSSMNTTKNIQVINNNNIQGSNAVDIANRVNQKTNESFDYSQFNANNQPSN